MNFIAPLPAVKSQLTTVKLKPDAKLMSSQDQDPRSSQDQIRKDLAKMDAQGK